MPLTSTDPSSAVTCDGLLKITQADIDYLRSEPRHTNPSQNRGAKTSHGSCAVLY